MDTGFTAWLTVSYRSCHDEINFSFSSFLFFFLLNFISRGSLQGQRADTKGQETNGIKMHKAEDTKIKRKFKKRITELQNITVQKLRCLLRGAFHILFWKLYANELQQPLRSWLSSLHDGATVSVYHSLLTNTYPNLDLDKSCLGSWSLFFFFKVKNKNCRSTDFAFRQLFLTCYNALEYSTPDTPDEKWRVWIIVNSWK